MSVGAYNASEEFVAAGRNIEVNGRQFSGPVSVLRNAHIREVSIVALGADPETSAKLFTQDGDTTMTIEALQAKVAELETAVAALTQERDSAIAEATNLKQASEAHAKEVRMAAVKQLFTDIRREFSDDTAAAYLALSQDAFVAVSRDLRASQSLDQKLFSEQATGGNADPGTKKTVELNAYDIYAARRQAAIVK
jgi:hypothetical protein